ncbi:potassium transporter TrkG [Halobacillus trueperi]|uniref:potassium transporter TrkG n=1 Tax=Halobacillus trueperi TaxID=156205 RepID=UPI001FC9BE2B|nr:potassium transporter TrkG [Halobacillus trueperi]
MQISGVVKIAKRLLIFSSIVECNAVVFLAIRWVPEYGWFQGIYASVFHFRSSFNSAGFSIGSASLSGYIILKALALPIKGMCVVIFTTFVLNLTEDAPFLTILFESVSAFGTVWLSMGLTGDLSLVGKVMIIGTMLIGKLGPLTFAFAFAKQSPDLVKHPEEDILIG